MKIHTLYSFLYAGILAVLIVEASSATIDMDFFGYEYAPHDTIVPTTGTETAFRMGGSSFYAIPPVIGGVVGGFAGGAIVWTPWIFMVGAVQSLPTRDFAMNQWGSVSDARNVQWKNIGIIAVSDLVSSYLFLGYELKNKFQSEKQ